jgi:autoinducer 2-degrading protein
MYIVCVTVVVKPGDSDAFVEATQRNYRGTRREPGNVRFDILRQATPPKPGQPEHFFLYEVYCSESDFTAHQQTPHYLRWRDEVAPMMAEPRESARYTAVFPEWEEDRVGEPDPEMFRPPAEREEMIVFLSYENDNRPEALARELARELNIEGAQFGVDMFTGGCEMRLRRDDALLERIRVWLRERAITHDVSFV